MALRISFRVVDILDILGANGLEDVSEEIELLVGRLGKLFFLRVTGDGDTHGEGNTDQAKPKGL